MTHTILPSLVLAAVLTMATGGLSQGAAEDFQVWQKNFGSPSSKTGNRRRKPTVRAGRQSGQKKAWPSKIEIGTLKAGSSE